MSCNHPKEEENSDCKPTVTVMANGKGIVRSNGVTAILNPPTCNVDVDNVVVIPSKTHEPYYDVNLPCNFDHKYSIIRITSQLIYVHGVDFVLKHR